MDEKHRDVHGHKVFYAEEAKRGVEYLDSDLDYKEAEVFFRDAKSRGQSALEDDDRRNFTLVYNRNGTYSLQLRKESRGWF